MTTTSERRRTPVRYKVKKIFSVLPLKKSYFVTKEEAAAVDYDDSINGALKRQLYPNC